MKGKNKGFIKRLAIGALAAGMAFGGTAYTISSQAVVTYAAGTVGTDAYPVYVKVNEKKGNKYALTGKNLYDYYYFKTDNSDDNKYVFELRNNDTKRDVYMDIYEEKSGFNSRYYGLGHVSVGYNETVDTTTLYLENNKEYYIKISASESYNYSFKIIHENSKPVVKYYNGKWVYFNKNGKADYSFTGLAKTTGGAWVHVTRGVFDTSYTGLSKSASGKWYYVKKGRYNTSFTGLAKAPSGKWYHVTKGKYNPNYTGLSKAASGKWYYVKKGKYDKTYTGYAKGSSGKWYYVQNGKVVL